MTLQEWQKYHYRIEKDYAKKILLSPPHSEIRSKLLREGYDKIKEITDQYSQGLSETGHTEIVMSIIQKIVKKGGAVFDIGCARGSLIKALAQKGYAVKGIDISLDYIKKAKEELRSLGIEHCVEYGDIDDYKYDGLFDCIVMDNVIEHIIPDTVISILKKCWGMLLNNSSIIILTPHKYSGPHDISYHFLPLGSKAEGFHFKEYSFSELAGLLKKAGFMEILGYPLFLGYYKKIDLHPSTWAARKAEFLEKVMERTVLRNILKIDRRLTVRMVSILFPGICIGVKKSE